MLERLRGRPPKSYKKVAGDWVNRQSDTNAGLRESYLLLGLLIRNCMVGPISHANAFRNQYKEKSHTLHASGLSSFSKAFSSRSDLSMRCFSNSSSGVSLNFPFV